MIILKRARVSFDAKDDVEAEDDGEDLPQVYEMPHMALLPVLAGFSSSGANDQGHKLFIAWPMNVH